MPTTDAPGAVNLRNLPTPRVVKCPTPGCPGWITLDITRHQTEPCRYCRIGVDTLRFLLSRIGAERKALPPEVHDEFNRLMLTMAGAWGQNVYLRPSPGTLVDLKAGVHGVVIEYNPLLGNAGADGPAPLVGIILHKLLHFEAHLGQRGPQISIKSGSRDKEGMVPLMSYLMTITDHAWVTARLEQLNPSLREAQSRWGLDVAQMLVGSESMFSRYLSERNLQKMVGVLKETVDPAEFRGSVLARLAALTAQTLEREKEETRRVYVAEQLANVRLMNAEAYPEYQQSLEAAGLPNASESYPLADRLYNELSNSSAAHPPAQAGKDGEAGHAVVLESAQFHRALEGAVKSLGLANYFEVKS